MAILPEVLLTSRERPYTIDALLAHASCELMRSSLPEGYKRLMGYNLPPWQREAVWTEGQNQKFIESILLGLGTGTYVITDLQHDDDGNVLHTSCLLIDGQQRISAIQGFLNNEFTVLDGIHYGDLTKAQQRMRFRHTTFPCVEVSARTPESTLKEMYYRLNFGGTPHTSADAARLSSCTL